MELGLSSKGLAIGQLVNTRGLLSAEKRVCIPLQFARSTVARTRENDAAHNKFLFTFQK